MPDVEHERRVVAALYPGPSWKERVAAMDESEVLAIYIRKREEPSWNVLRAEAQEDSSSSVDSDPNA